MPQRKSKTDAELEAEVAYVLAHREELHARQSAERAKLLNDPANADFLKESRERRCSYKAHGV